MFLLRDMGIPFRLWNTERCGDRATMREADSSLPTPEPAPKSSTLVCLTNLMKIERGPTHRSITPATWTCRWGPRPAAMNGAQVLIFISTVRREA